MEGTDGGSVRLDGSRLQRWLSDEKIPVRAILASVAIGMALAIILACLPDALCGESESRICSSRTPFPWTTLAAVVAAPCVLLTWYWRILHRWREIKNAEVSNATAIESKNTAAEALAGSRLKDVIDLLDGKSMSVFGGIHGLKSLGESMPSHRRLAIEVLESFIRLNGRRVAEPGGAGAMHLRHAVITLRRLLQLERLLRTSSSVFLDTRPLAPGSLSMADLSGADLSGLDLSGLDLRMATLVKTRLCRSKMEDVDLTGADLTGADLTSTNLGRAVLKDAILTKALCLKTDFSGAHAERVRLVRTTLTKVTVNGAWFSGARKIGVSEEDVDWKPAEQAPEPDPMGGGIWSQLPIEGTPTPSPVAPP